MMPGLLDIAPTNGAIRFPGPLDLLIGRSAADGQER